MTLIHTQPQSLQRRYCTHDLLALDATPRSLNRHILPPPRPQTDWHKRPHSLYEPFPQGVGPNVMKEAIAELCTSGMATALRIETTLLATTLTKTLAKFWALLRRYWHPVCNSWKFISGPCKCISASAWDKAWCTACHHNKDLQVHLRRLNLFTPRELLYSGSSSPKSRAFSYGGLFYNSRLSVNRWMEVVYKAR